MRLRLLRLAFVGALATSIDVTLFVALVRNGCHRAIADVVALITASIVSYILHRFVTFRDDPYVRWVRSFWLFGVLVVCSGLVDLAVVLVGLGASSSVRSLMIVKVVAVVVAAVVRWLAYRALLFRVVRGEQDSPTNRVPPVGDFRLSVVVPAFNEQSRIGATISRLRADLETVIGAGELEIVVADDGSSDETADAARSAGANVVVQLPSNRGKGAAVRAGVLAASGRSVGFTDADLAYSPEQLIVLLDRVESGWDVAVGNRRDQRTKILTPTTLLRTVGSRGVNVFTQLVLLGQYQDTQCGCKMFRADVAKALFVATRLDGFAFDIELFHLVERRRLSLAIVPVSVRNEPVSTVRVFRDGLRLLADVLRVRKWAAEGAYNTVQFPDLPPPHAPESGSDDGRDQPPFEA